MHKTTKIYTTTLFLLNVWLFQTAFGQSGLLTPASVTSKAISSTSIGVYWNESVVNETGYTVERRVGGGEFKEVGTLAVDEWEFNDTGLIPNTTYSYRVYAFNNTTKSGYSSTVTSTTLDGPSDLTPNVAPTTPTDPNALASYDVGLSDLTSDSSYDSTNEMFRLSVAGGQVWGRDDEFHYVYKEISGDVVATVKVSALRSADEFGKAGIMFRQSPQSNSLHAFLNVSVGNGIALERRHQFGEGTSRSGKGSVFAPVWLRLVRKGNEISAFYSADHDNWDLLATDTVNFSNSIYIGLAVAAHDPGQSIEADIGELELVKLSSSEKSNTYVGVDIGKVGVVGEALFDSQNGTYIVAASGGDIGHSADAFHYFHREISGDFEGVVKLDSLIAEKDWAKAGLMVRKNVTPDSEYFSVFSAKNVGVVYQGRTSVGGNTNFSMTSGVADPVWMKLNRTGNLWKAYYSQNGSDWNLQDQATINLPETVLFGMALTSHDETALAFADFSNLSDNSSIGTRVETAGVTPATNVNSGDGGGTGSDGDENLGGGDTSGGDSSAPTAPIASFTVATTSGEGSLTIAVNAGASSSNGGSIVDYEWNWGDGSGTQKGVSATHSYQSAGSYEITLTVKDSTGSTSTKTSSVRVSSDGLPASGMVVRELGYSHVELAWNDRESWEKPWMIQRSTIASFIDPTDLTHNQDSDNTGAGTFRWLGVNADNFVDIDGIEEGTTYFWRVAPVTNLADHYRNGAQPSYGEWIYGTATTGTLAPSKKRTYNVRDYGAVPNDGKNDYNAAIAALNDAQAAEGGIIYFPAGTYDIWPTDSDVTIEGGIPTLRNGGSAVSTLFQIRSNNITFLGDANGAPTTFWNLYLWGKVPATKWLQVKNSSGGISNVRRYFVFKPYDVAQTTVRNIDVDMGAPPVNTGKEWYTLDQKRYEWDISHKLWSAHDTTRGKNTIFDNVRAKNCRGEIIYVGGASEKILIKDCILDRSNSSSISMSADAEIVNCIIRDSSNAAVESILLATRAGLDGKPFAQNHIARGTTFIGLDQSSNGFMKNLPGRKTFSGWHVFNASGTYQSVTDSTFTDCINNSFGPWYEYRNGLRFNCTFNAVPDQYKGQTIFTWTSGQPDYLIDGGMSEILWVGDTVNVSRNWSKDNPFLYSQPGEAAYGSESPWIWDAVHFKNTGGGNYEVGRVWLDTAKQSNIRENAVFQNWTADSGISFPSDMLLFLHSSGTEPRYVNFLE